MRIPKFTDIQEAIDDQIAARGLDQYVDYAQYLPQDATPPSDATHILSIRSADGAKKVEVAIKAKGLYALLADAALSAL